MTFEQQVADAIACVWIASAPSVFPDDAAVQRACQQIREALAARVAAAIEAAIASIDMGYYWKYLRDESTGPALAALRGEKS